MHINGFKTELYSEHLEEAGFQYETRCNWLHDEEVSWLELEGIDFVIEAHLDALVLGGSFALKVALDLMASAEPGELHIIVRLFCRHKLIDRLSQLWKEFDFDDRDKVFAVSDALRWECPQDWTASLENVFSTSKTHMFPLLASAVASLSRSNVSVLIQALPNTLPADIPIMLSAISSCEPTADNQQILDLLSQDQSPEVMELSLISMMIHGDKSVLAQFKGQEAEFPFAFAIGGDAEHSRNLISLVQKGVATEDVLLAVGLAGYLEGVVPLLGYLKHPDLSSVAAKALWILSGAVLFEDVHVAESVEEVDLFESELDAYKKGELPKNVDGENYGVEIQQLSTEYDIWFTWFQEHREQFVPGQRYRNGYAMSPQELVKNLIEPMMPLTIRLLGYQELQIRYSLDLPFSPCDLIYKQKMQLNALHSWAAS